MSLTSRKFEIKTSSEYSSESEGIFSTLNSRVDVLYCGFYKKMDDYYLYIHCRNSIRVQCMRTHLESLGIDVFSLNSCKTYTGEIVSEEGKKFALGYRGHKKHFKKRPRSELIDNTGPVSSNDKDEETPHIPPNTEPTELKIKEKHFMSLDGTDYVVSKVLNRRTPGSVFGAVWGTSNGLWVQKFWVGPMENVSDGDQKSKHPKMTDRLLEIQDHVCKTCFCDISVGKHSNCDIDHIIPRRMGGMTVMSNLQAICVPCHRRKTALEGRKICRYFKDIVPRDSRVYMVSEDSINKFSDSNMNPEEFMKNPVGVRTLSYK